MPVAVRLLPPLLVALLAAGGCVVDTATGPCTPDIHCVLGDDGQAYCEPGYDWEDESDPENLRCVADLPDAGS